MRVHLLAMALTVLTVGSTSHSARAAEWEVADKPELGGTEPYYGSYRREIGGDICFVTLFTQDGFLTGTGSVDQYVGSGHLSEVLAVSYTFTFEGATVEEGADAFYASEEFEWAHVKDERAFDGVHPQSFFEHCGTPPAYLTLFETEGTGQLAQESEKLEPVHTN